MRLRVDCPAHLPSHMGLEGETEEALARRFAYLQRKRLTTASHE
jgi:hypothetical protein